jgi:serine/threonine protein phosphatase PrpC
VARFTLIPPSHSDFKSHHICERNLRITSCVIPGQDPFNEISKACQDGLLVLEVEGGLFAALFDGHGPNSEVVVQYCITYLQNFFTDHIRAFHTQPIHYIEEAITSCDEILQNTAEVDCRLAGTTAVVLFINAEGIHIGSVGDSRAVLGSTQSRAEQAVASKNFKAFRRQIPNIPTIFESSLTADHKPNHRDEIERILQAGGKVSRQKNPNTEEAFGPYRVWLSKGNGPGLAMSRSIGDSVAHSVGVSPVPVVKTWALESSFKFIVIASDGVWDVMENRDAVNLVEGFRHKCSDGSPERSSVKPTEVNIATLLALESRYRWLDLVKAEDVIIDDISVIVVELGDLPDTKL